MRKVNLGLISAGSIAEALLKVQKAVGYFHLKRFMPLTKRMIKDWIFLGKITE